MLNYIKYLLGIKLKIRHSLSGRILYSGCAISKEALLRKAIDNNALLVRADLTGVDFSLFSTQEIQWLRKQKCQMHKHK